jgi:quercetin dioxygenase-like cupin family protein
VAGWLLTITAGIDTLDVVEPAAPHYGPMQAFYFRSGAKDAACQEAPDSGLLIQTPEGVGEVTLLINEVNIQLGSTVYFQAQPGKDMTIRVVEGSARVQTSGKAYRAIAGSQITVPLNENLEPTGPPNPPAAYDMTDVEALPVSNLERPIAIQPPASPQEIEATQEPIEIGPDGNPLPPGLIDNPGLGDSVPPGHGGEPPGQDKDKNKDKGDKKDK